MNKLFGVVILLLGTFSSLPIANADTKAANCLEFVNPTSRSSSTVITLSVDVYAICTSEELGRANGQRPLYSMPQEEVLFNMSSCSGPSVAPGRGFLGTATCSLRIGSNTVPSPRTGATSTSIRVWFSWDFSEKSVSVSHSAIPAATNNGWGGSSTSGNSGGGSGTASPVIPSCTSAPNTPNLTIERNSVGPKFIYSLANTGAKATEMLWSYTLWDSNSKSWGTWNSWQSTTANSGSFQASPVKGKTSIAFGVYARNACGSSAQARESEERTGVSLAAQEEDVITRNSKSSPALKVGLDVDLYLIASSKYDLELTATTSTPNVCTVDSTQILLNARGTCKLLVRSVGSDFETGAKPTAIEFEVTEKESQKILDLNIKSKYRLSEYFIELDLRADSSLPVDFKSLTPEICNVMDGIKLYLLGTGQCLLSATQEGNDEFLPAPERTFQLTVTPDRMRSITCVKGKLVMKVNAANPKCPAGYKVKR